MYTREYKNTGDQISLLGLGCMRLPKVEGSEKIDRAKAQEIVDYAYAHGVNYFDTAYRYHEGDSELFIGEALQKYPRESYHLATKMPMWMVNKPEDVAAIFEDQLKRCRTEYFDFYLCHALNASTFERMKQFGAFEYLQKQKEAGRIRHLGFSFHDSPEVLRKIVAYGPWEFTQIQLNYLDWELQDAKGQYEVLTEAGLPVIVMEPVRGGALATLCPESDEIFRKARPDKSIASWAIRFAAARTRRSPAPAAATAWTAPSAWTSPACSGPTTSAPSAATRTSCARRLRRWAKATAPRAAVPAASA